MVPPTKPSCVLAPGGEPQTLVLDLAPHRCAMSLSAVSLAVSHAVWLAGVSCTTHAMFARHDSAKAGSRCKAVAIVRYALATRRFFQFDHLTRSRSNKGVERTACQSSVSGVVIGPFRASCPLTPSVLRPPDFMKCPVFHREHRCGNVVRAAMSTRPLASANDFSGNDELRRTRLFSPTAGPRRICGLAHVLFISNACVSDSQMLQPLEAAYPPPADGLRAADAGVRLNILSCRSAICAALFLYALQ